MNRTGGLIALGIGIVAGLVLALFPQLDIVAARWFSPTEGFPLQHEPSLILLREANTWIVVLLVVPAIVAATIKFLFPHSRMLVRGRTFVLLVSTLILGPWLLTNVVLKDNSGRPRPRDVVELGGPERFLPWWNFTGPCQKNCSFVAGEPSGAAWTFAPAALTPPAWRPVAYAGAMAFTGIVGVKRMAFGGHFLSDVVFAGVLTFFVVWLMHGLLYRWRTRISDESVEAALARAGEWLRRPFGMGKASVGAASSGHDPRSQPPAMQRSEREQ
jgi:lipid A 4'-phosphatase